MAKVLIVDDEQVGRIAHRYLPQEAADRLIAMANARGTPIEIAIPEGVPEEKKALLRFLGVELIEVEDELCPIFPSEGGMSSSW